MNDNISNKLLEKSKEAFLLAIETYNKPTIKYRVESFAFLICNAWELMLKAHLIEIGSNIYYKDKPNRTISLSECIKKVFTNAKDPIRLNLEKIVELRDTSTHFITEEYEMLYIPLFQACVYNYANKIQKLHNFDITSLIQQNFLTLTVCIQPFDEDTIRAKYPTPIASKLINISHNISDMISSNNEGFAIKIKHFHYITKNKDEATELLFIDKSSDTGVKIVKELQDPSLTHKYTMKKLNLEINKRLKKLGIDITFNKHHFQLFCKYYDLKNNKNFCYINTIGANPTYSYSMQAIEFIVHEISKDPNNIIEKLKK